MTVDPRKRSQTTAEAKAQKRAEALRANLKRRKEADARQNSRNDDDAKPQNPDRP